MNYSTAPDSVQKMFAKLVGDFEREDNERIKKAAQADPYKYRDCKVMEGGLRYTYYRLPGTPKGKTIDFCYSKNRNVAGYYLTWTEVWNGKNGYRTNFHGCKIKADAIDYCRERLRDAQKPKAERKYVLPPFKRKA